MKKKNQTYVDFTTGIFMLVVFALLAYFTIVISGADILHGRGNVVAEFAFDSVGGLKDHDTVMYRGMKVGTVEKIELREKDLSVVVKIDNRVILREGYRATVANLSMLGGNYMLLEEGEGEIIDLNSAQLKGVPPVDWMRELAEVAGNLKKATSSTELKEIMANIRSISARAEDIASRISRGEGLLGKMLSPEDTLYNDIKGAVAGAKDAMSGAKDTLDSVKTAFDNVNAVAEDVKNAQLVEELKSGIAAFRRASESFDMGDEAKGSLQSISAEATRLLASLNEVADKLKNGESTIGKLMASDGVYNEVEGLVKDIRQVLDNYRDTTPIATFGSLATGAL